MTEMPVNCSTLNGAMTFGIMTNSIITFSIMTLCVMKFSIIDLFATLHNITKFEVSLC